MKKKNFFTGSVFQFYIPEIKKYEFCKFFDFKHLSEFHGLLAQVYDRFSDTEDNSIEELITCDWLFGARSMNRWPNMRKDARWKSLGILSGPADDFVPDFKGSHSYPSIVEDESHIKSWYVIHKLVQSEDCDYSQVHHLERIIITTSSLGLAWRTGMEYCRINNLPIEKFYDLNDIGVKNTYLQMINVPIYKSIPEAIRGKAILN
jgi:hypothetical protein